MYRGVGTIGGWEAAQKLCTKTDVALLSLQPLASGDCGLWCMQKHFSPGCFNFMAVDLLMWMCFIFNVWFGLSLCWTGHGGHEWWSPC